MSYIHERLAKINGTGDTNGRSLMGRFSGAVGGELVSERDSSFDPYENRQWVFTTTFDDQVDLYNSALLGERRSETVEKAASDLGHTSITGANGNGHAPAPRPRTSPETITTVRADASVVMVPQATKVSAVYL